MEERQTNYTIMEGYELPSRGKVYNVEVNPHVELRSMSTRDEMKRQSPSTTPLKTLADIIEGCLLEKPGIHVYDMCIGDYEFLLHKLRIVTYGTDYKLLAQCPNCGEYFETTADLGTLEVKSIDEINIEEFQNIILPKSNIAVNLKFTTPHAIEQAEAEAKAAKKKFKDSTVDFETLYRIIYSIDSVDGQKLSTFDLEKFLLDQIDALDFQKILLSISRLNDQIGINTELEITCPVCDHEFKTFFRIGQEFFRPTTI